MSDSWVPLPRVEERVKVGRWAKREAKALVKMHGEPPQPGALDQLTGDLAGWAQVSIDDMPQIHTVLALTNVPPVGVDALGYVTAFQREETFQAPADVQRTDFDLHATERVTPRSYEEVGVPLGPGVKTFVLRRSSFNGVSSDVRNVDYFVFPNEYPDKCVVVGAYWPNPEHDEYIFGELENMVQTLSMFVQPEI